ncbi:hypothetical protein QQZ08_003544 [Neonectria magnoliae]|uniref:Uncharacterized protein n=1 Tax=Neonectria magnoliae TaxID=2732573 RepID=A0ABR1IAJ6_9HYPO
MAQATPNTQLLDTHRKARPRDSDGTSHTSKEKKDAGKKAVNTQRNSVLRAWIFEILLLLWSVALLFAIFFTMMKFRGKELPNWGNTITLNALIAILATLLRTSIALIALEITGQTKWDWISRYPRPVQDMQAFDDASRGVIGSLNLLRLVVFRMPLTLAAIYMTLCSLAIGPFTQQAIQTYQCLQPDSGVAVIVTVNREYTKQILTVENHNQMAVDFNLRVAIGDALVNPSIDPNTRGLFRCQPGNCTFPTYANKHDSPADELISHASLGICSRCFDVHDLVVGPIVNASTNRTEFRLPIPLSEWENDNSTSIVLPPDMEGFGIPLAIKSNNLTWSQNATTVEMLNRARWAAASFSVLVATQKFCKDTDDTSTCRKESGLVAASCMIYPCLKYYRGSINSGVLDEQPVHDVPLRPQDYRELLGVRPGTNLADWKGVQQPCLVNGTLYTSHNMSTAAASLGHNATTTVFVHTDDWAGQNLSKATSYVNVTTPLECVYELRGISYRSNLIDCDPWYMATLAHDGNATFATIDSKVSSLAYRLTREIRMHGWGPHQVGTWTVKGDAWRNVPAALSASRTVFRPAPRFELMMALEFERSKFDQVQELAEQYDLSFNDAMELNVKSYAEKIKAPAANYREALKKYKANSDPSPSDRNKFFDICGAYLQQMDEHTTKLQADIEAAFKQRETSTESFCDELVEILGPEMLERSLQRLKKQAYPQNALKKSTAALQVNTRTEGESNVDVGRVTNTANPKPDVSIAAPV